MKTTTLFNYPVCNTSYSEITQSIHELLTIKKFHTIVTLNPEIVVQSKIDPEKETLIQKAKWILPDGIGILQASKLIQKTPLKRITGSDLIPKLFDDNTLSFYFIGGTKNRIHTTVKNIRHEYPHIKIHGFHDGFFSPDQEQKIIKDIQDTRPDIVLVGMGFPKQEELLHRLAQKIDYGIGIGIGGLWDVFAGAKPRAPKWVQKIGFEWAFRTLIEPKRIQRWGFIPRFMWLTTKEVFQKK